MTQLVGNHTNQEMQKVLADFLPNGDAWATKGISESLFYKVLLGLSKEDTRIEDNINSACDELQIPTTEELIGLFEQKLGIPDGCFSTNVSLEQRRRQIQFKLALKADTRESFIAVAAFFGIECRIENASIVTYPLTYPWEYTSYLWASCTLYIDLPADLDPNDTYPLVYPWIYSTTLKSNFIECIFEKIKNATCRLIFRYIL